MKACGGCVWRRNAEAFLKKYDKRIKAGLQMKRLEAEGIGSRTKWWFWPNAFLRECVGLMVNRMKLEIVLLIGAAFLYAVLSFMLI